MLKSNRFALLFICCLLSFFVKAQVKAAFASDVSNGCTAMRIRFTDKSAGQPTAWFWDFGNGDTSVVQNPTYTYNTAGTYNVKLSVKNATSNDFTTSTITVYGALAASFNYNYTDICIAPASINFTADTVQSTAQYNWIFSDGAKNSGSATTHTYTAKGQYNVTLITVTDKGCADTVTKPIQIGKGDAGFESPAVGCLGQLAVFTNTSVPLPRTSVWTIDNGASTYTGQDLPFTFITTGTHTIQLNADFGTCKNTATNKIIIAATPKADFTASGTLQSCQYPQTASFTNNSSGATSYLWLFGDGATSSVASPSHVYNKAGSFTVKLISYNSNGCSDTLSKTALVQLGPPVINRFINLPISGCIPVTVNFKADISSGDKVTTYDWDFGDGTTHGTDAEPMHIYTKENYYRVMLNVKTSTGCTGAYSLFQAVAGGVAPGAVAFSASKTNICASDSILFTGESTGNVSSYSWDFGDGAKSSGHDTAMHQYLPGDYTVTYYLSDKGCAAAPVQRKSYIHVRPPVSKFQPVYYCNDRLKVSFTDQSIHPQTWAWTFGDGQMATTPNPTVFYTQSGQYPVTLTTTNSGCSFTVKDTITVVGTKPAFAYTPGNGIVCRNIPISATINDPSFISGYTWNMGNGVKLYTDTSVNYIYNTSGTYQPWLIVKYINGCADTIQNAQPVKVFGAAADFNANGSISCLNQPIGFTDKSVTDGIHPIKSWLWEYGDGKSMFYTSAPFEHVYDNSGTYNVKLTTTDNYGCIDTTMNNIAVQKGGAQAAFNYNAAASCDSALINFSDASVVTSDPIKSYAWSFGDNGNSTQKNPVHYYISAGAKQAILIINTALGCKDTAINTIDVAINKSPSVYIISPDSACVLSAINFSAKEKNNQPIKSWQWSFGNGDSNNTQNPVYTYAASKNYIVQLVAIDNNMCADTAVQSLVISPLPNVFAGSDTAICAGGNALLQASGAEVYNWLPASTLSCANCAATVASPPAPTIYYVSGKNAKGCTAEDSVFVDILTKNIVTVANASPVVCGGNSVQLNASGANSYSWQPPAGLSDAAIANPVANPSVTTNYTVTGTDSKHCYEDVKSIVVTVAPKPVFNIIDTFFIAGQNGNRTLKTTSSPDVVRWQWLPATGLSCYNCAQPNVQNTPPVVYTAIAYNNQGCSASDQVRVEVLCNKNNIFIPAAFTPNGDGKNDRFYPLSSVDSKVISFVIYNKLGQVVFSKQNVITNSYNDGWNGMYKSAYLGSEIYIYRIEVECQNEIIPFTGTVTLIR